MLQVKVRQKAVDGDSPSSRCSSRKELVLLFLVHLFSEVLNRPPVADSNDPSRWKYSIYGTVTGRTGRSENAIFGL